MRCGNVYLLLAVLMLCIGSGMGCRDAQEKKEVSAVKIRTAPVTERDFREMVQTQGVVEAVDHAVLSALTPGRLLEVTVDAGDRVKAGQLLFRSDAEALEERRTLAEEALKMAEERVKTREVEVNLAKVTLAKAKLDYRRSDLLYAAKSVSDNSHEAADVTLQRSNLLVDQAHAALTTAKAEVKGAAALLDIAVKNLKDTEVRAPYDGVITKKYHSVNEFCNIGTPVLAMDGDRGKRIAIVLSGLHFPKIDQQKTFVEVFWAGKLLCKAPVTVVDGSLDPASRTFELKADLPKEVKLPSGTLCDVRVILDERRSYAVPEDAVLFRTGGKFAVYTVKSEAASEIPVETGLTQNGFTELPDGSKLKDLPIIVSGQYLVNDGSLVEVLTDQP